MWRAARDQCDARLSKSAELLYEPSELAFELFEPAAILLMPFDRTEFRDVKILDDL